MLEIYNNQQMSVYNVLNRPVLLNGEPFDPLVDLVGENWFGQSQLKHVEGHIMETPIVHGQTLITSQDRDPKTYFKIERGYHEWIELPEDKEWYFRVLGKEFRERKEYGFIFTHWPETWEYEQNKFVNGAKGRFLIVKSA